MKKELLEIFDTLSHIYYEQAVDILDILPEVLQTNCTLTRIDIESTKDDSERNYDDLKVSFQNIQTNLYNYLTITFYFRACIILLFLYNLNC